MKESHLKNGPIADNKNSLNLGREELQVAREMIAEITGSRNDEMTEKAMYITFI